MKKTQISIIALVILSLFISSAAGSLFTSPIAAGALLASENNERANTFVATESNQLIGFDFNKPEEIICQFPLTGLQEGEKINSLALENQFRGANPSSPLLLAATNQGRFYFVHTATGVAFQIAPFRDFRLFIGEDFDATFLPLEADTSSNTILPAGPDDKPTGPSINTHDVVAVTPDGDKIVSNLILKALKGSIHLAYKEGDMNFGKQPCITDISAQENRLFGFDKNQCALVEIDSGGSMTTIANLSGSFENGTFPSKNVKLSDVEEFLLGGVGDAVKSFHAAFFGTDLPDNATTTLRSEAAAEDEIENEVFIFDLETGDVIRIGSIKTDSGIRAVAFAREFELEPDYVISADHSTITIRRGETLKNLRINITRRFGFTGNVTVNRPDVLPDKVKIKPTSRSTSGDSASFKKIQVKGSAQPGVYPLEFTAIDEMGRVRKTTVNLVIE